MNMGPSPSRPFCGKTTRRPLYCHPKFWCDAHLGALRVEGLDKEYPIEHVLLYPVRLDPGDSGLFELLKQIPGLGKREDFLAKVFRMAEKCPGRSTIDK